MSDTLWSAIIGGAFMLLVFILNKESNDKRDEFEYNKQREVEKQNAKKFLIKYLDKLSSLPKAQIEVNGVPAITNYKSRILECIKYIEKEELNYDKWFMQDNMIDKEIYSKLYLLSSNERKLIKELLDNYKDYGQDKMLLRYMKQEIEDGNYKVNDGIKEFINKLEEIK